MMTIKDAVYTAFMMSGVGYSEMTLEDIALLVQEYNSDFKDYDLDVLYKQVSSYMANATTKTVKGKRVIDNNSIYQRVKNGKGGFKKGTYKLRKPKKEKTAKEEKPVITPLPSANIVEDRNYCGAAGEMAVCSELLFREYNISRMAVDDGVDIVAIKNGKTYYIQVKTVQLRDINFTVQINENSFQRYCSNDCYYIIVARAVKSIFFIFTADDIKRMIVNGDIKQGAGRLSITFNQAGSNISVKSSNVNYAINSFERIV
jgi:hypothetical protein